MTTEQLAALREVAEHVSGPFQSALHEATWREEFRKRFTPATCLELLEEVERLREVEANWNDAVKAGLIIDESD